MTTIKEQLDEYEDYISYCTLSTAEMDDPEIQRRSFTAWSTGWVYFPVILDGLLTIGRVPRSPCSIEINPIGSAEGEESDAFKPNFNSDATRSSRTAGGSSGSDQGRHGQDSDSQHPDDDRR